jgi:[ribosomal protein S5]-alanine N-acetyltransferase
MKRKTVRTKRLELRPFLLSDYQTWLEAYTERLPKQSRWDFGPYKVKDFSKEKFRKVLRKHKAFEKEDECYIYGVFERKSKKLVGHIDFTIFERGTHQFANFGYLIHNRYWGNGYGREAARAGLFIGFRHLKLNRLEAAINLDHKKSIALVRAIGMRREGVKKRYWFEHGKWVDHLIYVANPEDVGMKGRKPL